MGCDIHIYAETKQMPTAADPEPWDSWMQFVRVDNGERWYAMFAALAGVRAHDESPPPKYPPRGLPADLSWGVQEDAESWSGDGHTHHWLTTAELEEVLGGKFASHREMQMVLTALKAVEATCNVETRVVFWFDN